MKQNRLDKDYRVKIRGRAGMRSYPGHQALLIPLDGAYPHLQKE